MDAASPSATRTSRTLRTNRATSIAPLAPSCIGPHLRPQASNRAPNQLVRVALLRVALLRRFRLPGLRGSAPAVQQLRQPLVGRMIHVELHLQLVQGQDGATP